MPPEEGEALLERRERALEEWDREHGLKPTRRPSDLAGADRERREELEHVRHDAHSDLQRTEVALEKARREVTSGGPGAGFSRAGATTPSEPSVSSRAASSQRSSSSTHPPRAADR